MIPAHTVTNFVTVTNYAPRPEIVATVRGVSAFVPQPWGGIAGGVVAAVLSIWGSLATRKSNRLAQVEGVLIDNIETGRDLLRQVPGGEDIDKKYVATLVDSQTAHGVRLDIHKMLKS